MPRAEAGHDVVHVPELRMAELSVGVGVVLVHVPYYGQLAFGSGERNAWNRHPQDFLQVPTSPDEWLPLAVEAYDRQHLGKHVRRLLFDQKAAAQLDLEAFAQAHPNIEVVVLDAA